MSTEELKESLHKCVNTECHCNLCEYKKEEEKKKIIRGKMKDRISFLKARKANMVKVG